MSKCPSTDVSYLRGYDWQDELCEEDEDNDDGHQANDGKPTVTRHTLVFAMPKPSDWDDLDVDVKMKRKRRKYIVHAGALPTDQA